MKIGFVGLGRMGRGMALNLAKAKVDLRVHDLSPEAVALLVEAGARAAADVAELARECDVIFTSLPGPVQVEEVVLGPGGILENMRPGLVLFDLSTSSVSLVRRLEQAFRAKGGAVLDAPISGGPAGAASGDLALWIGGDAAVYERHLELLRIVGKSPRRVGDIGAGTVAKLVHNLTGYLFLASFAETFSMGVKAGVDPLELWEAMRLGMVGRGSPLNMLVNQFLPGKYEPPAFALKLAHKDVMLATGLAKELGIPMRLSNMTLEEMTEALARGMGEQDSRAYMQLQLERAGVAIAVDPQRLQQAVQAAAQG
ncbi:MAG TPA: NAD(P)-dependent oxidoreductase [Ramlibacter sp.]|nr:NAD(P)-dependent oxidoreductase [Ramlibacter sp.]